MTPAPEHRPAATEPRVVATTTGPWPHPVEMIDPVDYGYFGFIRRLVRASGRADVMILRGTSGLSDGYAEAIAATLIKLLRRRPPTIFVGEALFDLTSLRLEAKLPRPARRLLPRLSRLAVRMADGPHVRYGVLSTDEERQFEARWGIESARVTFTPYYATVPEALGEAVSDGGYIFAGGNTLRDYGLLVEASSDLGRPVKIASTWNPAAALPPNVEVFFTSVEEYNLRMAAAGVIVVPLRPGPRSTGQQTYLSAMLLGKPMIVTDAPGVRDHVEPGETAIVVEPELEALRSALRWTLDPANREAVERIAAAGRRAAEERYLEPDYYRAVYEAAVGFWEGRRDGAPA